MADDIIPVQNLYKEYSAVSGLNINVKKSVALCINTPQAIQDGLNHIGIKTPETMTHLGIELGKTMEVTIEATLNKIQPKAIRRRILATTPPTDLLHRSRQINQALTPIYNLRELDAGRLLYSDSNTSRK